MFCNSFFIELEQSLDPNTNSAKSLQMFSVQFTSTPPSCHARPSALAQQNSVSRLSTVCIFISAFSFVSSSSLAP
jgi:hypothetical protein